jgi:L-glyceraldehyde 3-phosphate reductase
MTDVRALNDIAANRRQSLAQLALAWTLRDRRMTSTLIGAGSVEQVEANVAALDNLAFTEEELAAIGVYAVDGGLPKWTGGESH